jgi:non-specific serine/threonine protein kinase
LQAIPPINTVGFSSWFFHLGFCNKHKPLSPSLAFWRDFAGYFVEKLRLTPDIKKSRDQLVLPLADDDLERFRETAPLMSGGEYLDDEVFLALWALLHDIFAQRIRIFEGPVAEFIKQHSPDIHLVGRIYFHLVENKKSETPFAFLATYSTRLNDQGESRHLPL